MEPETINAAPDAATSAAPPLGRLGPYDLEAELGRGAMGIVYRAWHTGLKRRCALKVMGERVVGQSAERFQREAQSAARLGKHPNIVQIFDVGEADGRAFIAMELVGGRDLAKIVGERGRLPEAEAFEVVRKVALALDHAHRCGIIHRDLKPSNVIVDAQGEPQLTDFGLALDVDAARLTAEGDLLGTPQYMAPEQAENKRGALGPRTDIYALGATLFDLLTGRPPFEGSVYGILTQIILDDPPPLRKALPGCSLPAEAIVTRAMEKRPEDRYATALELADDLGRALAGDPTRARPRGLLARGRMFARRHRALVSAAVGALAVLVAVGGVAGARAARAKARRDAAVQRSLEALAAENQDARVQALEESAALDREWPAVRVQLAEELYARAIERYRAGSFDGYDDDLARAIASIDEALERHPEPYSLHLAGTLTEWRGEWAAAAARFRKAQAADPDGYWGKTAEAGAALLEGKYPEVVAAATRAIEIDPGDSSPFLRRSVARLALGDTDGALADADATLERLLADDWCLTQRARVRLARGELRLAAIDLVKALTAYPEAPTAYGGLAALARREGAAARAAALDRRAEPRPRCRPPPYLACRDASWAALAPEPGPAVQLVKKAEEELKTGDALSAVRDASAAIGLSPADGDAFRVRSAAFRALGRAADAAEDARWAALLAP